MKDVSGEISLVPYEPQEQVIGLLLPIRPGESLPKTSEGAADPERLWVDDEGEQLYELVTADQIRQKFAKTKDETDDEHAEKFGIPVEDAVVSAPEKTGWFRRNTRQMLKVAAIPVAALTALVAVGSKLETAEANGNSPAPAGSDTEYTTARANSTAVLNLTATETQGPGYFQNKSEGDVTGAFASLNADQTLQTVGALGTVKTDGQGKAKVYTQTGAHLIVDVQGYLSAEAYQKIPSKRILDTGPTALPAGSFTEIFGQPNSTAWVYVAADDSRSVGYYQAMPYKDMSKIGKYANLNTDRLKQTRGRPTLVTFNENGSAFIYSHGSSRVTADIEGYFSNQYFEDVEDVRLLDTRSSDFKPGNGSYTEFYGRPGATGVLSIVGTENVGPGYVQLIPCGAAAGGVSNLNFDLANQIVGNLAFAQFDSNGKLCVYSQKAAHFVVDLAGYMKAGAFEDTTDARALDTRNGGVIIPPTTTTTPPTTTTPNPAENIVLERYEGTDPILVSEIDPSCTYKTSAGSNFIQQSTKIIFNGLTPDADPSKFFGGDQIVFNYWTTDPASERRVNLQRATNTNRDGIATIGSSSGAASIERAKKMTYDTITLTKTSQNGETSRTLLKLLDVECTLDPAST